MNTSSISTHQHHGAASVTVAHPAAAVHVALALYQQAMLGTGEMSTYAPATSPATTTAGSRMGPTSALPGAAAVHLAPTAVPPVPAPSPDPKEHPRQQIIDHVNELIRFCAIPQKKDSERITSVRQCSSSFFVLLCQRLFDVTIQGIDIYPNTPEKKRQNVSLVLEELEKNGYDVADISAADVVQLNEVHLSRLILLFVSIAQERGLGGIVGWDDGEKTSAGVSGPQPPPPFGTGMTVPPPGYTLAEVAAGHHFARQGVVTLGGQVIQPAMGATTTSVANMYADPPQLYASPYYYPAAGLGPYGDGEGIYDAHQQQQQPQHPSQMEYGEHGQEDGGCGGDGISGEVEPASGYEESHTLVDDDGSLYADEDDMLTREEIVNNWYSGLVSPDVNHAGETPSTGYIAKHAQQPQQQSYQRSTTVSAHLADAHDIRKRIKEVSDSLTAEDPLPRRQGRALLMMQQRQLTPSGGKPREHYGDGECGTIPTPSSSSSLTADTTGCGRPYIAGVATSRHSQREEQQLYYTPGFRRVKPRQPATSAAVAALSEQRHGVSQPTQGTPQSHHAGRGGVQRPAMQRPSPAAAAHASLPAHRPQPIVYPLEEPPLTRVECRLLASHPRRLIDTDERDRKIERLRAARFLGDMQGQLRRRMRTHYDTTMMDMREELKRSMRQGRRAKVDLMRRVRDENGKYKDAYAVLMESAANDPHAPRHMMSWHTTRVAEYYAASLGESRRMCDYLQEESERRNLSELVRYAQTTSAWQQRMPV